VPNVANSVTIWQTFRDAYSKSVIFGKQQPQQALSQAGGKVQGLAKEGS
jgi:multiple sugar transport system substrate-binding protein